jgi:fructose-bisphosphate aldolase class 1
VYFALCRHRVLLEGTILKPNMVVPGAKSGEPFDAQQCAEMTLQVLQVFGKAMISKLLFSLKTYQNF